MRTSSWLGLSALVLGACMSIPVERVGHLPDGGDAGEGDGDVESMDGGGDGDSSTSVGDGGSMLDAAGDAAELPCGKICSGETSVCNPDAGSCVECTVEMHAACTDESKKPYCLTGGDVCVQCNEHGHCNDTAPVCGDDNACRGCLNNEECAAKNQICQLSSGQCVDCEPNAEDPTLEHCANGKACHPTEFTCTGQPRRSLNFCGKSSIPPKDVKACVSDSECVAGHRCVPTEFPKGTLRGSYCLLQVGEGTCPNRSASKRPAKSSLGIMTNYCFPDDAFTTCEGIWVFQQLCDSTNQCSDAEVNDRQCVGGRCTYGCDSDADCSNGCTGTAGNLYCDPN